LILGVGVGSLEEEFTLLGAPFADRGERGDDAMRALRAALSQREPSYAGEFYEFSGLVVDPCAVQQRVPLWVGGRSYRSLRRAMELGDGWAPFGLRTADLGTMLERARDAYGRSIDVVLQNEHPLDPVGEPDRVREQLRRFAGIGATHVNVRFVHHSPAHYVEQLEALQTVAADL
jgi:alkanesulfonate monooxygenase SsuD/methylene tetrahydromethanopterin reductase-like flavin-dependent oxidoreductase (luciferase family)